MVAELQHQIDLFEARLKALLCDYPDDFDFWPEFVQVGNEAEAGVFAEHLPAFQEAMVSVLQRLGKLPSTRRMNGIVH